MRVSIINCVSTAAKMMAFSDRSLFCNAGHDEFDYVVVKWQTNLAVDKYLEELPLLARRYCPQCMVHIVDHQTRDDVGYVPNLRAMMNDGFSYGFQCNQYAGLVNTDCYFGPGWLANLVKYAASNRVINSRHITAAHAPYPVYGIVTEDLGVPEPETFDVARFYELCFQLYRDRCVSAEEINGEGGYRQVATMPYLFHRTFWHQCGPWELELTHGTPDVRFFDRMHEAGAQFALSESSIVYHHEAVERRRVRPSGAEHLPEE